MNQVKENKIKIKPKWYFILGSIFSFLGLLGSIISASFLTNLLFFLIKPHFGPGYSWRLQQILNHIPYWLPLLTLIFIFLGFYFLKKYDFSYKKNFSLIIIGLILAIIFAGFLMNTLNLNNFFIKKGPRRLREFYRRLDYNQKNKFNFKQQKYRFNRENFKYNSN